ncbi:hypothetical protein M5K25_025334 [Dendrobium thyrsiflorum]|uniref:Uncharacterized protein n=1 Tax=Dendrobium thyrsiflorum TaxID=117978 RepID=A0ABD0U3W5_DENTH
MIVQEGYGITAGQIAVVDCNIFRVLKMNSIRVEAVARGCYRHIEDMDSFTIVKLEVTLRTVLDGYARDCYIVATVQQSSHPAATNKRPNHQK